MTGNKNSGRHDLKVFEDPVDIRFQIERRDAERLNEMAKELTKGNRSALIAKTLKRLIEKYESR